MPLAKLACLGLTLPAAPTPIGAYVPAVRTGNLVFVSGQLPLIEGKLPAEYTGKLGFNVSPEGGQAAARQAALNVLAILEATVGLDKITRIVRLTVHVASTPCFTAQPAVANGASELMAAVFGDAGVHSRAAVGACVLPMDACVELELIAEVGD